MGGSGSGKSTVIRLLYRFYQPKSGAVLIGGQNIMGLDLGSVRRSISVVPQDCVLFHDTIKHNIGYGNLGAPTEEVERAAMMAELHSRYKQVNNNQVTECRWPRSQCRICYNMTRTFLVSKDREC